MELQVRHREGPWQVAQPVGQFWQVVLVPVDWTYWSELQQKLSLRILPEAQLWQKVELLQLEHPKGQSAQLFTPPLNERNSPIPQQKLSIRVLFAVHEWQNWGPLQL